MKDYGLSAPSQESQLKQPGGRQNESSCVRPTSVSQTRRRGQIWSAGAESRKRDNSPLAGLSAKACAPQMAVETVHHADTCTEEAAVMDESVSCVSGNLATEVGDFDQSEKPKHSKKRRQRRKCAAQQVVGLPRAPSAAAPVLLWFRRDLRLCDNPALSAALQVGAPVIPFFIWSPEEEEGPGVTVAMGGACKSDSHSLCCSFELWLMINHIPLRSQVNTGYIKLCLVCVHLWSATAAISSSSAQRRREARVDLLCGR